MSTKNDFVDILLPRNGYFGFLSFVTGTLNAKKSMKINEDCTPQDIKDIAANSEFLKSVIEDESVKSGICKHDLKQQVIKYLDEIAAGRNLNSARLVIYLSLRISYMWKIGMIANASQIFKVKELMGNSPLLFLPTHRSYADGVIVAYLCFQYDIELPTVAAGVDIGRMAVIGKLLRDSATFYIRRNSAGVTLYKATLGQYVQTLVTSYNAPLEFYIEGTRTRGNKSIAPKYGMLSMALTPMFLNEVSDVLMVPVHISYERLPEQLPIAYEHLGLPKPKESNISLIKAVLSSNGHFGNIYTNIGTPFYAKSFLKEEFKDNDLSSSIIKSVPSKNQQITDEQFIHIQNIGNYIIALQQKYTVTNVANLIAVVLMGSLVKNKPLTLDEVISEVKWTMDVMQRLGAFVLLDDLVREVDRILVVHSRLIIVDNDQKLKIIANPIVIMSNEVKIKLKGHTLKDETIATALPIIQLHLYVNPLLYYFVPPALILVLITKGAATEDKLAVDWHRIRKLLKYEFFYYEKDEDKTFRTALEYCIQNKVIAESDGLYSPGADERLQFLLKWTIWPTLTTLLKCADVMTELKQCEHKKALKAIQEKVEMSECHPYCLSLDVAANCLKGLVLDGSLLIHKGEDIVYELVPGVINECGRLIEALLPKFDVEFGRNNAVILHQGLMV